MTCQEQWAQFMCCAEFTPAEKWIVKWQIGQLGHFNTALAKTIALADGSNLEKLAAGFPDEVAAFRDWAHGNLASRLRAVGLAL